MANWVTISALATAAGTLVLAVATFASVRSANRAARVAERALFAGLRPLLVPSRVDLLYGDLEGGQRIISRFVLDPREQDGGFIVSIARHWNVDRPNPR
jgi:hypothetical protein